MEVFTGVIGTIEVGGIADVAQFISGEPIEVGVIGVEFGSGQGAVLGIEAEEWSVVARSLAECLRASPPKIMK